MKKNTKIILGVLAGLLLVGYIYYNSLEDSDYTNEGNGNGNGNGNDGVDPIDTSHIPDDYREPEILIDDGNIWTGFIPDQFTPEIEVDHKFMGAINLQDVTQVDDLGLDRYEVIDPIELSTLEYFEIGAGSNQFKIQIRHVNALTYEFTVVQNYTGFIVNGITFRMNGEEVSALTSQPLMYQFPSSGDYDIDIEIFGGQQDFDDYSSDSGLENEFIYFTLNVEDPSQSEYSSGTAEVAFNDMIYLQQE